MYLYYPMGSSTIMSQRNGITIDSNELTNAYYYSIYSYYYAYYPSVSHNKIISRTTSGVFYDIRSYLYTTIDTMVGNKITMLNTSTTYGMYLYGYQNYSTSYEAVSPMMVANNEIRVLNSGGTVYGIYDYQSSYISRIDFINNSIYINGASTCYALYTYPSTNTTTPRVQIYNNSIHINTSGTAYMVYFAGNTTSIPMNYSFDYNNYYRTGAGTTTYYGTTSYTTLSSWISAYTQDLNSTTDSIDYVDVNTNLELLDYRNFTCPRIDGVLFDINAVPRTLITTKGAYSKPLFEGYNLKLSNIISPEEIGDIHCFEDYTKVEVELSNAGSMSYNFDVNNVRLCIEVSGAISFYADTLLVSGTLLSTLSKTVEITNSLPISTPGLYHLKVYLNSDVDTIYSDDTLYMDYRVSKIVLPYDVDFSTEPPELIVKQLLGTSTWTVESGTGSNPTIVPNFGSGRLQFSSEDGLGSMAQVIINGIDLRGTNKPTFEFWYAHDNQKPINNDFMLVKISTDGGLTTQTILTLYRYHGFYTTPDWEHVVLDMSAFAQETCLSIIFEGNSYGGGNQNIDRIRISSQPDLAITLIAPEENDLIACDFKNKLLQMVIENKTSQVIDFDIDTTQLHLEVTGANTASYTYPLSGKLSGFSVDTIQITDSLDLSYFGLYDILAYVDAIDSNRINDTARASIFINPDLSIKDIDGVDDVNCKEMGDSVYVSFKIINMGNILVQEIPVKLQINNKNDITDIIYTDLYPGDTIVYFFTEPYIVPAVSKTQPYYTVKIQTELTCDIDPTNNAKQIMACVDVPDDVDLRIHSINTPIESICDTGLHTVYVSVTLINMGDNDIESAVLHVELDSAGIRLASFSETTESIVSANILTHTFTKGYVVPNFDGNYGVKVYVDAIENDDDLSNDTLLVKACAVYNDVSIENTNKIVWYLGQNTPNPASQSTAIPYTLPQAGKVNFKVINVSGQILHQEEVNAKVGANYLHLTTEKLSAGIYYYSMEYNGQRIVKKMTIQE